MNDKSEFLRYQLNLLQQEVRDGKKSQSRQDREKMFLERLIRQEPQKARMINRADELDAEMMRQEKRPSTYELVYDKFWRWHFTGSPYPFGRLK